MAEIDPVILQLRADVDGYIKDVRNTTKTVDQQLGLQEKRVRKLETEFKSSTSSISGALKGLAATFAAAFTGRELVGLLDSFTRLQNNLKVAGQEGAALVNVQSSLLDISQQYGVNLEALSSVFLKASLAQKELGASTEDIIRLNEVVAASLKITGTSTEQARGALLQLGQALGSDVVRGEEFNSLLENALPLVQAAANGIDRYGGSVAKLRQGVVNANVSSREFFEGILKGGIQTISDAEKATLTLSGGVTALTSALTVYFGEADKANGVSAALGTAIKALADNLDILIPAIAAVATGLGVGFVTNATRASLATGALSRSATGATTSLGALSVAARGAGASLFAAFGGPIGVAILAVGTALALVATEASRTEQEINALASAADQAENRVSQLKNKIEQAGGSIAGFGNFADTAASKVDGLNTSMGVAISTAVNLVNTLRNLGIEEARQERLKIARERKRVESDAKGGILSETVFGKLFATSASDTSQKLQELDRRDQALIEEIDLRLSAAQQGIDLTEGSFTAPATVAAATKTKKPGRARKPSSPRQGPSGPTAEEISERFNDELVNISQRALSNMAALADTAEDRAELELRGVELARLRTIASIEADEDYSAAQKDRLIAEVEAVAETERQLIALAEGTQIERERQDLADERYSAEQEALRLQLSLAGTDAERRALALKILEAEDAYLRSKLEAVIASDTTTQIERQRAQIALQSLNATAPARREEVLQDNEGALARYARGVQDVDARIEELAVEKIRDINDSITNALADELGIKDDFVKQLFSVFLESAILGPLAEALSQGGAGGDGIGQFITTAASAIFGRSSGGRVDAGSIYRVNEGASPGRVEAFRPDVGGQIIPLGRMDALRGPSGGGQSVAVVRLQLSGDLDARIESASAGVAVEVVRGAAPEIIDAAAQETFRRSARPGI